jgi:nucleoside-diphosphate-sugar epimerase
MTYPYKNKTILITGATGFIGGAVARRLLAEGCQIKVLARTPEKAASLQKMGAEVLRGDLTDYDSVRSAMDGVDVLIHVAGAINLFADEETYSRINALGTTNVCKAALDAGVKRFIHTSTVIVHGLEPGTNLAEDAALIYGDDLYCDTKIDSENIAWDWIEKGLPGIVVRPSQAYGPEDGTWTIKPIGLLKKNLFSYADGGKGVIQAIYIDDLVDGYLGTLAEGETGEVYALVGERPVPLKEFFGYYVEMLGKRFVPSVPAFMARATAGLMESIARLTKSKPVFTRAQIIYTTRQISYSGEKAKEKLGFVPKTSLEDGMKKTEEWLRGEGYL